MPSTPSHDDRRDSQWLLRRAQAEFKLDGRVSGRTASLLMGYGIDVGALETRWS